MKWFQLYIKAPPGSGYTTPEAMKYVDDLLINKLPAAFVAPPPKGLPVQCEDGTWEVRVFTENGLSATKQILTEHFGLEIVREVENE